jgi:hypothetical protein
MGYAGWHGVTDKSNQLLAICYEPIEGTLGCRFKSRQEPYLFTNVPENVYQVMLRTPYAGSYFRKHVKGKYPMIGENLPAPYQPTEKPTPKDIPVIVVPNPERDLFGQPIRYRRV